MKDVDRKAMTALSSGHLVTDLAQGALPALLPFLIVKFDLSYAMAGALVLAATISSSIVQPFFGLWSDARGALWLLPAGVAVAGVGMAAASVAPSYALVFLCILVAGLGVAAYHPEASKFASYVSGRRRASGMAFFSVGGNVGFALGPLVASFAIVTLGFGLDGGLVLALPGLVIAAVLVTVLPYLSRFAPSEERAAEWREVPGRPAGLALLLLVVGLRSIAHMGLFTFIPLFELTRGRTETYGSRLLALFLVAGAAGTLAGGPLADRFGRRKVLAGSFVVATPAILVYALDDGVLGVVALVIAGAATIGTFGVSLVMSQEYLPSRVGLASGLSIGLAIGLGGVAALALGVVADATDVEDAVIATALGPALALLVTLALPPAPGRRLEPAASPV